MRRRKPAAALGATAALLGLAALVRLIGVGRGLPHVYDPGEPFWIAAALPFRGGLRPSALAVPGLWPSVLEGFYAAWFVLWSGFGFLRGRVDFVARYAFSPGGFYLIARLLAVACSLALVALVARLERGSDGGRWPYGAALLALSPALVGPARSAGPEAFMVLLAAGALAAALRFQAGGRRGWLLASAFLAGLAAAALPAAAPAALVVPLAWLLREDGPAPGAWLLQAAQAAALGFFLAAPAYLLDPARFLDAWNAPAGAELPGLLRAGARSLWCFGGAGSPGGAAAVFGLLVLLRRDARRAALLLLPVAACGAAAAFSAGDGASAAAAAFPALALLAGEGLSVLGGTGAARRGAVALLALAPGALLCWRADAELLLPDTRAEATRWLAESVPPGSTLLLDRPDTGPFAIMDLRQCEESAARAERTGSPRAPLFAAMAARHPGGGYRLYRLRRRENGSWPETGLESGAGPDGYALDVRPGLDPARAVRVDFVVTSSFGADPRRTREDATFFEELAAQAELVREFPSEPGRTTGPWLRAYRLRR